MEIQEVTSGDAGEFDLATLELLGLPPARAYERRLPDADALPAELRARPQWVCWRLKAPERTADKPGKVPVNPKTGENALSTKPETWGSFDSAAALWKCDESITGVGYVFAADDPYVGIDVDKCRDPSTGVLTANAQAIIDRLDTWSEISVGLTGIHSIARGVLDPAGKKKTGDYEMYDRQRFFTVSGLTLRDTPIREAQADLEEIRSKYIGDRQHDDNDSTVRPASRAWTPEQLAAEIADIPPRAADNAPFMRLWAGDTAGFPSRSEADLAFCGTLAYYCRRDPILMDAAFRASAMMRPKWDRADYRNGTLSIALSSGGPTWISHEELLGLFDIISTPDAEKKSLVLGPTRSRFTLTEFIALPPEPKIIVDGYMLEDAGGIVAPGGTGKTTLALQECVHIILGKPLYGRQIVRPGPVLFITAEDDRGTTQYRMFHICKAMELTHEEMRRVQEAFYVEDISASGAARLVRMIDGELRQTSLLRDLIESYRLPGLSYIHIDPTSLVGPGEASGNDGMAELMRAARRLSREVGSAVRLVHHVSKAVSREGTADQYAGRGGSAFADNARFIHQLITIESAEFTAGKRRYNVASTVPQAGIEIAAGNMLALMTHKLSYQRRDPAPVFIVRRGFAFDSYIADPVIAGAEASLGMRNERVEVVAEYIKARLAEGLKLNSRTLQEDHLSEISMKRSHVRLAIDMGLQSGRLIECELPEGERRGLRKTYLAPGDDSINGSNRQRVS